MGPPPVGPPPGQVALDMELPSINKHSSSASHDEHDKMTLLSASPPSHPFSKGLKIGAICLLVIGAAVGATLGVTSSMVTPPTTAGLTLTNIQLGSKSVAPDNAAYSDMCSYSLPITIQGALPSHMSIPSFVTTKTANPSVTITDRTTSTLIASTTDITLSFPTPTTFTLTTHFDFQNTTPPALAAVLSASRNGSPYSLAIAFSAVVTAHGFGIQLSSTTIDDTLVVPSGTAATPPAATVSDYTTVITALAITATSVGKRSCLPIPGATSSELSPPQTPPLTVPAMA